MNGYRLCASKQQVLLLLDSRRAERRLASWSQYTLAEGGAKRRIYWMEKLFVRISYSHTITNGSAIIQHTTSTVSTTTTTKKLRAVINLGPSVHFKYWSLRYLALHTEWRQCSTQDETFRTFHFPINASNAAEPQPPKSHLGVWSGSQMASIRNAGDAESGHSLPVPSNESWKSAILYQICKCSIVSACIRICYLSLRSGTSPAQTCDPKKHEAVLYVIFSQIGINIM